MAPSGGRPPDRRKQALKSPSPAVIGNVFEKSELTAGFQHAYDFIDRRLDVRYRTEYHRGDDDIERVVRARERFGTRWPDIDVETERIGPIPCPPPHVRIGFDRVEFDRSTGIDRLGEKRKHRPGTSTEIEYSSVEIPNEVFPMGTEYRSFYDLQYWIVQRCK